MRSPADYISHRAHAVDASGIRKVFDLAAKMKDPINLSIGLPDFDVPELAKNAAIEAIRARPQPLHADPGHRAAPRAPARGPLGARSAATSARC